MHNFKAQTKNMAKENLLKRSITACQGKVESIWNESDFLNSAIIANSNTRRPVSMVENM